MVTTFKTLKPIIMLVIKEYQTLTKKRFFFGFKLLGVTLSYYLKVVSQQASRPSK
jgi:hypothetical protein